MVKALIILCCCERIVSSVGSRVDGEGAVGGMAGEVKGVVVEGGGGKGAGTYDGGGTWVDGAEA